MFVTESTDICREEVQLRAKEILSEMLHFIVLPSLRIKFGIKKNFVKAMNKEGEGFCYLRHTFSRITKINRGQNQRAQFCWLSDQTCYE